MTDYVIMKGNLFVAPAGSHKSYTSNIRKARRFSSREAAQADACGNERVVPLEQALRS